MNRTLPLVKIIFAGGGTGGHLYPAIAIANRIVQKAKDKFETEIIFVGTKRGIEYRLRDRLGYPLRLINTRGLTRALTLKNLIVPFILIGALLKAGTLIKSFAPDVVVGTGGYVSWPVLKRAASIGIPTVLQEQNSFPGVTTRQLAPKAKRIYLGFEKARALIKTSGEMIYTGNPVRTEIGSGNRQKAFDQYKLDPNKKTILILGGSQGARAINNAVVQSLKNNELKDNYQILWQSGRRDYKDVSNEVGSRVTSCALFPFAENMADIYAAADLVIARAGALTLAELAACGLPSILIPYPYAAGNHQRHNANDYVAANAAIMLEDSELEKVDLLAQAVELLESGRAVAMSDAARKITASSRPAVDLIAEDIIALVNDKRKGELLA